MTETVQAPDTPRALPLAKTALAAGLLANAAGQSLLFVLLPPLGRRLGFSDIQTGALLSLSALLLIVSAPAWGYASERIGRRPVLLLGLAAATGAPLLFAGIASARLDGAIGVVLALAAFGLVRGVQALAGGGLLPVAQAYMADTTPPGERAGGMGLLGAAYGIGAILGAAVAWGLGGMAPALAFGVVAGLGMAGLATVALATPEPVRGGDGRATEGAADGAVSLAAVWPFLLVTLLAITAYGLLQQVMALRLQDAWGFSTQEATSAAGGIMMATSFIMILVQGIGLRLLRWAPAQLLRSGALLAVLALALATLARGRWELLAAMGLFGAGIGLMLPGNLASLSLRAGPRAQGRVAGLNAVGQGIGLSLGPILGASLHQMSPTVPFLAALLLLALVSATAIVATATGSEKSAVQP